MILFIDTTEREQAKLALIEKKSIKSHVFKSPGRLSEKLPLELNKLLAKNGSKPQNIKKIAVVRGPGSFIGTRTGVAFANALSWALNKPIAGLLAGEDPAALKAKSYQLKPILVKYAAPPNITQPKKALISKK